MTKREKRLYALQRKVARLEAQREYGIKLLVKAVMELPNARKQVDRLRLNLFRHPVSDAGKVEDAAPVPTDHVAEDRSVPVDVPVAVEEACQSPHDTPHHRHSLASFRGGYQHDPSLAGACVVDHDERLRGSGLGDEGQGFGQLRGGGRSGGGEALAG